MPIGAPAAPAALPSAAQLQAGPPIEPLSRIFTYDAADWELFIEEWLSTRDEYLSLMRASGASDRGIDVAAFTDGNLLTGVWDNYQCKHYAGPLSLDDVLPEIGKILWHSFNGAFAAPRAHYFVAPRNASTQASQYLANAPLLQAELVNRWNAVRARVTKAQVIPMNGPFAAYVASFDFSIFKVKPVREVIAEHKLTSFYLPRFGGSLPARPAPGAVPETVAPDESNYVGQLLAAYSDHAKETVADTHALTKWDKLHQHFKRQREAFYHAEALRVFVRDKVTPGTFESLQDEVYTGVVDACDADHADGYQRVIAVTGKASTIALNAHPLGSSALQKDRHGICHQLANDDRLKWTK